MNLYQYGDKIITTNTFINKLEKYIKTGDTISMEIDTMRFGKICKGLNRRQFFDGIFNIFYELVGESGNIIIPTFSYSWGQDSPEKYFDVKNTHGKVGGFPEYFRKRVDVFRSIDPMFSFGVWGKEKEKLSGNENRTTFGNGSLYDKTRKLNAKLIAFGLNKYDPTFVHYVEQHFHENISELDYRFVKRFEGVIVNYYGKEYKNYQFCFSRHLDRYVGWKFDETRLVNDLQNNGKLEIVKIGNGKIWISDCDSVFKVGMEGLNNNRHYFISKERGCSCMDRI